jgi:glycosyltransferase involved in cell wall biosynthesis
MRILVFLDSLYTGGAEFSTLTFYGALLKKGYDIKLVGFKQASPAYSPADFGITDIEFLSGNNFWQKRSALKALINTFKPHIVHSVLFNANLLTRTVRLLNNTFIHLESLVNEMYSSFRLADPNVTRLKLEGYRLVDRITQYMGVDHFHANGVSVASHYQQKLGIGSTRITIIPRGRELNAFVGNNENRACVRAEFQTGNRLLIINVARHEFQKGHDVLIEAIHQLENKNNIQVVLVGREGKQTPVIQKKIEDYQLHDCVKWVGHRNDVSALLAAADIFVFPSRFEGLPGALIEAAAAGLPIICTDIPNNREVAVENVNALFFPVDDSQVLSEQLDRLIRDNALRQKLGSESLKRFKQHFLIGEVHQRMEKLLLELKPTGKR